VKVRDATRRVATLAAAVVACSVCAERPAVAQNRGVYPLGMSALAAGTLPDTGMTYANQLIVYSRDRAKDDAGRTVATGANAVVMDMNTFTWVSAWSIGGFRYAASATLPFAWNSLTSDAEGAINQGRGFADSYYLPLIVGRAGDRGAVRAQYGFLAPTGKFSAGATDNVGSGYWTHTLSSGQTLHLASGQRVTLSAFELYELHTEQRGSNIRPADTFDLDASLMGQVHSDGSARLSIGVVGYLARQLGARTGSGVPAESAADRYAVHALGVALSTWFPSRRASVGLKYFRELANRSTFEGYSVQGSGAITF
jgi:hypothetical protein